MKLRFLSAGILLALLQFGCRSNDDKQVVMIFHAASLSRVLARVEEQLEEQNPKLDIRLEPSGSQVAARKISELNMRAELILTADWRVIDEVLMPEHTDWLLQFASNEIVLIHAEHSPYTQDISQDNWPELLLKEDVRLGRADENTAPVGFHTLLSWKLAQKYFQRDRKSQKGNDTENLAARLKAHCRPEHVVPDVAELVSLLEARSLDYIFAFRSIAEEHNLKITRLPREYNLGRIEDEEKYSQESVSVQMKSNDPRVQVAGTTITYGLTIPKTARNKLAAIEVARFIVGAEGRRILMRSGFIPIEPARSLGRGVLPKTLSSYTKQVSRSPRAKFGTGAARP